MRYRVEVSDEAEKQLSKFPPKVRDRIGHAIDELEEKDDSQWSNISRPFRDRNGKEGSVRESEPIG
jgi:mRNA-degrading endonuclease RelE of RelBE toxin-antitoxin system